MISEDRKVNWLGDVNQEMFRKIFNTIRESETYILHMENGETGFHEDLAFAVELFKEEIAFRPLGQRLSLQIPR